MFNIANPFNLGNNANALTNPIGQSFKAGTPAPMFDPMGYMAGWYKPGSTMGNAMNAINDPLKIFQKRKANGLLG